MNYDAPPSTWPPRATQRADGALLRLFFGCGSAVAVLLAVFYGLSSAAGGATQRALLVSACAALAAVFVVSARLARGASAARVDAAVRVAAWATLCAAAAVSGALGTGVRTPPLGFLPLVICLACVLVGVRFAVALTVGSVALLAGLLWAELHGLLPPASSTSGKLGATLPVAFLIQTALLTIGLVAGVASRRALGSALADVAEREQRFRKLLGIAADWYWEQDEQLRYTYVSEALAQDTGIVPSQLLGRTRWEVDEFGLTPEQWDAHRQDLHARRPFRDLVMRCSNADGLTRYVSTSGEPMLDAAGRFTGYWGVGRNVTDSVLAQRSLHATEARYRELFASSPSPLVLHHSGVVVEANAAAVQLLGYADAAAMVGVDMGSHHEPGAELARARARTASLAAMPTGVPLPLTDFTLRRTDGRSVKVQVTSLRVELGDGPAVLSIYRDITAQRAAEQALRGSQALLTQLFDTTPDTVSLTERSTGRYLMINEQYTRTLGWNSEEAIGRTAGELGIWHREADRERLLQRLQEQGTVREMPAMFRRKSGALVPLRVSGACFTHDGIEYLVVVGRDMAAAEQARLEREAILQHASIGIAFTRNGRFVHVNPRFEEMFGWPADALQGESGAVVWPSAADHAEVGAVAGPLLGCGQPFEMERQMRRRDGSLFWCSMRAQAVDPDDPSRGGTIWIGEDVTERRRTEQALAAARDAAEAASRAKSAFLANTSHEIRTPLNGLLGLARLVQAPGLDAPRRAQYLQQILESATSLSSIISDILDLSKIEAGKLSLEAVPFSLREVLEAGCRAHQPLAEARGLTLALHVQPGVPETVLGDPMRVRQILGNYIANALKFTERGGVRVEVARAAGERLRLSVADTGCGIDAVTQARLFRPFTQADDSITRRYGGTGLGLSICRELALLMMGEVGVVSEPGRGALFWAELPLPATTAVQAEPQDEAAIAQRLAGAHVLLVEDNAVNMMIATAMLEQWRVRVTPAHDGQQALDAVVAAERTGAPFDAVLMDVQMPVMSGHEAARRLRERWDREALPIVALTAAALVSEREQALAAGMDAFLTKPIDAEHLQRTLARVLGDRVAA